MGGVVLHRVLIRSTYSNPSLCNPTDLIVSLGFYMFKCFSGLMELKLSDLLLLYPTADMVLLRYACPSNCHDFRTKCRDTDCETHLIYLDSFLDCSRAWGEFSLTVIEKWRFDSTVELWLGLPS